MPSIKTSSPSPPVAVPLAPATPPVESTAVTTPAVTTPAAAAPLDAAAAASALALGAPSSGEKMGIAGLTQHALAALSVDKDPVLALIPGRVSDAVALPSLLKLMADSPEGKGAVKQLIAQYEAHTGISVPPALVNAALAKPERLLDLLIVKPEQLSASVDLVNQAVKSGKLKDTAPMPLLLPQQFALTDLAAVPHEQPSYELKPLVPGLFQGDIASGLDPAQAKANMATAEIFDRLADNHSNPQPFSVSYGGETHTTLASFVDALVAAGHTLEARVEHRIANFANLKTPSPDGAGWLDVPAAMFVRTGVKAEDGEEALVPTVHTELVFAIRAGASTQGAAVNADIKWYQGVSGTGFFPVGLAKTPSWCGGQTSAVFTGADAQRAAVLAGAFGEVIRAAADVHQLAVGGYGATGVCNDSVAIVQHALTGATAAYPLLMRDQTLQATLHERAAAAPSGDYALLEASVAAVPTDVEPNATAKARALASIPWSAGQEPFAAVTRARVILGG